MAKHIRIFCPHTTELNWRGEREVSEVCVWPEDVEFPADLAANVREQYAHRDRDGVELPVLVIPLQTILSPPPWSQAIGAWGLVIEDTIGGVWVHGEQTKSKVIARTYRSRGEADTYFSMSAKLTVGGKNRRGFAGHNSRYLVTRLDQPPVIYETKDIWLYNRTPEETAEGLLQLKLVDWPAPPEVQVLRDLVLSSPEVKIMRAEHQHCAICRREEGRSNVSFIEFRVPPAGAGRFYARRYPLNKWWSEKDPRSPERIRSDDSRWKEMLDEAEQRLKVGEVAFVHPECIGMTLDW